MSIVSVSRLAGPPHLGQATLTQSAAAASGETPFGARSSPRRSGRRDRQLVVGDGHLAAVGAVDDRDRRAPEPLPGEQPVAQPEVDRAPCPVPSLLQDLDDPRDRLGLGQAVQRAGVDQLALAGGGDAGLARVGQAGVHDDLHRQPERAREVQVALVVRGHGHDRAVAVVGQHVVGGPDRDALAVDRVDRVAAQEDAGLVLVGGQPLDVGQLGRPRPGTPRTPRAARR